MGKAKNLTKCCWVISGKEKVKRNRESTRKYNWDDLVWTEQREKSKFFGPNLLKFTTFELFYWSLFEVSQADLIHFVYFYRDYY